MIPDFAELTAVELLMCRAYRRKEKHLAGSCSTWRTFAQAFAPWGWPCPWCVWIQAAGFGTFSMAASRTPRLKSGAEWRSGVAGYGCAEIFAL